MSLFRFSPRLVRFARDDSGVATIFGLFMIMMMVIVGGIGADLMRAEMERTRMQGVLDTAVLAAAGLDPEMEPRRVVREYLDVNRQGAYLRNIEVTRDGLTRRVEARAHKQAATQFMHLLGLEHLPVPARSAAEESLTKIEVSLVLDISAGMQEGTKMTQMRKAVTVFAKTLLEPADKGDVSIAVVPYGENVSVGPDIFAALDTEGLHDLSWCLELPDEAYLTTSFDTGATYTQLEHFAWRNGETNDVSAPTCPDLPHQTVLPVADSLGEVERRMQAMTVSSGGKAIYQGLKWGAALLDPSTRDLVSGLIARGALDPAFEGSPVNYGDTTAMKSIVVLSDSGNGPNLRLRDEVYATAEDVEFWRKTNLFWWLDTNIPLADHGDYYYVHHTTEQADLLMDGICTATKQKGIVIWAVGLEIDTAGADALRRCASTPSHYFDTTREELDTVFRSIAYQLTLLRLTI